ncbi:MAG: cysteine synthase family protein [Chloroflexi bacterium]|nr:cysteine synthase family protein [Chloroflexota bacterium]
MAAPPSLPIVAGGQSLIDRIGNTPLLRLERIAPALADRGIELYGKAEWFNPGGSVKDRPALQIILDAEADGYLTADRTLIDSTSGNTGIAYAMIGAARGYRVALVMPRNVSQERKAIVAALGAQVIYTDPLEGSDGAILEVRRLVQENPERYFYADQYSNPSNPRAHELTTGPEIIAQTGGRVTHLVAGMGTSGTVMGVGRALKRVRPAIQVIGVMPDDGLHAIEGMKHMPSAIVPANYREAELDQVRLVDTETAYQMARRLASREGLLVGPSSGAAVAAALAVAETLVDAVIVAILPDSGMRYLSTSLFEGPESYSI